MGMSVPATADPVQAQPKTVQAHSLANVAAEHRADVRARDVDPPPPGNRVRSTTAELMRSVRNAHDEVGKLQRVDQAIIHISENLQRMRTLATQAASDSQAGNRATLNTEFQKLMSGIDHQAQAAGLDSGGRFAAAVSVAMGSPPGATPEARASNVTVDLSNDVMDARGLGLKPDNLLATRANGTTLLAASATGLGEHAEPFRFTGLSAAGAVAERQVLSLSAADATGKVQSVSVTLDTGNAATAEQAVATLNAALQQHPVLRDVLALEQPDAGGKDGIRLVGALENFSVHVGTATRADSFGPIGLHDATPGAPTAQGMQVDAAALGTANLRSAANAGRAVGLLLGALEKLAHAQGSVGKAQNQLAYALALVHSQLDQGAPGAQIRDTRVALEHAQRTRARVLQADAAAAHTQANSLPEAVLALLRS